MRKRDKIPYSVHPFLAAAVIPHPDGGEPYRWLPRIHPSVWEDEKKKRRKRKKSIKKSKKKK